MTRLSQRTEAERAHGHPALIKIKQSSTHSNTETLQVVQTARAAYPDSTLHEGAARLPELLALRRKSISSVCDADLILFVITQSW